ncbi:thermonuclease family protein [Methylobacillus sp. Pita2]|uniref:thermonuclease family protein n=1 Tax=Methylobacillus sp. Pita2 TaxID=3383245 RepID=UPI0038B5C5FC
MKLLITALLFCAVAQAATLTGKVVSVADGDTLTILEGKTQHKIRLNAIDAPESRQDFGNASKKSLSEICFDRPAEVVVQGTDDYGRSIGEVSCQAADGRWVSANTYQVSTGMAWVYRQYSNDPELLRLEEQARSQSLGLWSQPSPIPPWDFRHGTSQATQRAAAVVQTVTVSTAGFTCAGKRFCTQMTSCEEAKFYLRTCGIYRLDRDGDGIPCESICKR